MKHKMLRNHGSLKKGQEVELNGKQSELFISNGFSELVQEECSECEDSEEECSECEKQAEEAKETLAEPKKKKATVKKK